MNEAYSLFRSVSKRKCWIFEILRKEAKKYSFEVLNILRVPSANLMYIKQVLNYDAQFCQSFEILDFWKIQAQSTFNDQEQFSFLC